MFTGKKIILIISFLINLNIFWQGKLGDFEVIDGVGWDTNHR